MLSELRVSQLGVIGDLSLVLGRGMTALTGETGAGKTLVVEALELLVGGRAESDLVRSGAEEALVEGRFELSGEPPRDMPGETAENDEVVLRRVVPAAGRARAYVDGRMVTASVLAEMGASLVDLHGQHAHQSLLSTPSQRDALDTYAGTVPAERARRDEARDRARHLRGALEALGGDAAARERELALLSFQVKEIRDARIDGADEDDRLAEEEDALAKAASHRAAAEGAYEALQGDDQVLDQLGKVANLLAGHGPMAACAERLRGVLAELADVGYDLRSAAGSIEEDPERLALVTQRRSMLRELVRKYAGGGKGLRGVLEFLAGAEDRLVALEDQSGSAAKLAEEHAEAVAELERACRELGLARRAAAGGFAAAVQEELQKLAMPHARFEVAVGMPRDVEPGDLRGIAGEDVSFLLCANPGEPLLPLSRTASGGELARAMLALRLVLAGRAPASDAGPRTLVFDEVDAGIGGEAALAVGGALAELAARYQVVVVTHLAQVAAFADAHVAVSKVGDARRTEARAHLVSGEARVVELSRMLSGRPESTTARLHAEELLRSARAKPEAHQAVDEPRHRKQGSP